VGSQSSSRTYCVSHLSNVSYDDWKLEYKEASEDYRFFVQVVWQSTLAVLAVDGVLVGAVIQVHMLNVILGFLPLLGALLTFIMASQQKDWNDRWMERIAILQDYDRRHQFRRYLHISRGYPLRGYAFLTLQVAVGVGLTLYAIALFVPGLWFLLP